MAGSTGRRTGRVQTADWAQGRRVMLARARRRSNSTSARTAVRHRRSLRRDLRRTVARAAQGRVRISGPSSVMAMVCSVWADRRPSAVTTVHSSSSSRGRRAGRRSPSARRRRSGPGPSLRPLPGLAPVRDVGLLVHGHADAVARCTPAPPRTRPPRRRRCTAAPMSERRPPATIAAMPAASERLGDLDERARPRGRSRRPPAVKAASPCQPSTIAPQSIEMMSPSSSRYGPGDAVHDHVVRRGADHRRERRVP